MNIRQPNSPKWRHGGFRRSPFHTGEIGEEVNASLDLDEVLARSAALIKRHIDYESLAC